ncbi:tumor necrosis factor receptor superfamily member 1A-like [Xyrauchen texanus]|uniref:tumor necrosis factor receptor superfamily member 1A-like n=1 Tax=Xyrauchen texanus TaxID=154827 RepID=UPI002241CAA5|nr:tumor necrosis factor receptor superfamily member 1A-like [Xyrauchen texanus]
MKHDNSRHWRTCQLSAHLLLVLISQSYATLEPAFSGGSAVQRNCSGSEYWNPAGFCCDKCHPGFKLKAVCPNSGTRSRCVPCEDGTYRENSNNFQNCFSCQHCRKPHSVVKSQCRSNRNTVCGCKSEYYMKIIDPLTWECAPCRHCGIGQWRTGGCIGENNTKCECKEKHYSVSKYSCKPCDKCRNGCEYMCTSSTPPNAVRSVRPTDSTSTTPQILVPVCACIMVLAVGAFMIYKSSRLWRKKKQALSSQKSLPDPEAKFEDKPRIVTLPPDTLEESVPFTNHQLCEMEQCRELPDCVPREIKHHEFSYFVLDEVPVGRFKELIRRLDVSESEIERAEKDHRSFKDAQYQMLKVWTDRGSGSGGNNVVSCHLIKMLTDTLKTMYLAGCADSIEKRFFLRTEVVHTEAIESEWRKVH